MSTETTSPSAPRAHRLQRRLGSAGSKSSEWETPTSQPLLARRDRAAARSRRRRWPAASRRSTWQPARSASVATAAWVCGGVSTWMTSAPASRSAASESADRQPERARPAPPPSRDRGRCTPTISTNGMRLQRLDVELGDVPGARRARRGSALPAVARCSARSCSRSVLALSASCFSTTAITFLQIRVPGHRRRQRGLLRVELGGRQPVARPPRRGAARNSSRVRADRARSRRTCRSPGVLTPTRSASPSPGTRAA